MVRATAVTTVRQRKRSSLAVGTEAPGPRSSPRTSFRHAWLARIARQPQGARATGCRTAATALSSTVPYPSRRALMAPGGPTAGARVARACARSRRRVSSLAAATDASSERKPADFPDTNKFSARRSR